MKKAFILLSFVGSWMYANATLSCENITKSQFDKILLDYKDSIQLNHFKSPGTEFTQEDKQHISNVAYSSKEIKKCQSIMDLNQYGVDNSKLYLALYKLKDFKLTHGERRLFDTRIQEAIKKYKSYSSVSAISNIMSKYPLVYLAVGSSENLISVHEFRLKNDQVEKYRIDTNGIILPLYSGTVKSQNYYVEYLNKVYQTSFKLPSARNLDKIGDDVQKNIKKSRANLSPYRQLEESILNVNSYLKYNNKVLKTDILKGSTIKYLHNRDNSTDYVIEYNNKKWTISEKQWNDATGGR